MVVGRALSWVREHPVGLNEAPICSINLVLSRNFGDAEDGVIRSFAHGFSPPQFLIPVAIPGNGAPSVELLLR